MQSTTSIKTTTKDGQPIIIRLGDMFVMRSEFASVGSDVETSNYIILGLLTVAILPGLPDKPPGRIYFSMIGMDKFRYSMSKATEDGLIILDHGKEIELDEKYMIKATKALAGSKGSGLVGGLELYIRTIITSPSKVKKMNMHKLETRLIDLSKWPRISLRPWAIHHLGIKKQYVPPINHIDDRTNMINAMVKLSASMSKLDKFKAEHSSGSITTGRLSGLSGAIRTSDGVITGRLSGPGVDTHNRLGKVHGVPFINLRPDEISLPLGIGQYVTVYTSSEISRHDVSTYMIICMDSEPQWVLVGPEDEPQDKIIWKFHNGDVRTILIKAFSKSTFRWLSDLYNGREVRSNSPREMDVVADEEEVVRFTYDNICRSEVLKCANGAEDIAENVDAVKVNYFGETVPAPAKCVKNLSHKEYQIGNIDAAYQEYVAVNEENGDSEDEG